MTDNYNILPQGYPDSPCSTKNGLITYVHDLFKVTKTKPLNSFSISESQIVKINEGGLEKPINIFDIYWAPRVQNEKYCEFIQEISPLFVSM